MRLRASASSPPSTVRQRFRIGARVRPRVGRDRLGLSRLRSRGLTGDDAEVSRSCRSAPRRKYSRPGSACRSACRDRRSAGRRRAGRRGRKPWRPTPGRCGGSRSAPRSPGQLDWQFAWSRSKSRRRRGARHREIIAVAGAHAERAVAARRRRIADTAFVVRPSHPAVGLRRTGCILVAPEGRLAKFIDRSALADAAAEKLVEQVALAVQAASAGAARRRFVAAAIGLERRHDLRARAARACIGCPRAPALQCLEIALHFFDLEVDALHELALPPNSEKPQPARRDWRLASCNCSRCLAIEASCLRSCAGRAAAAAGASSASSWRQTRELAAMASDDNDASASVAATNAASLPRLRGRAAIRCNPAQMDRWTSDSSRGEVNPSFGFCRRSDALEAVTSARVPASCARPPQRPAPSC